MTPALPSTRAPHLEVRPASSHGLGVFAIVAFPRGSHVITHRGVLRRSHEITPDTRAMQVGDDLWLCQDPADDSADNYLNHSCDPNIGFVDGTLSMLALRDIAAGEELLWDYSTSMNEPGWRLPCRCGATMCRGAIESYCDLPPVVRERLRPIALAYLRGERGA